MLPSSDSGEDAFGICGPDEWFGIMVCLYDESFDGGIEVGDRPEDAAAEALPRELGEEAFDRIEP